MENVESKAAKSRHLPILEFFENLQVEYIVADLRHKIYPKLKDKAYWNRVKDGKKATIEKLADKNSIPSIFSDSQMLSEFNKKVYRPVSHPNFVYRDENHKLEQEFYDLKYYYAQGSDVRIDTEDRGVLIGKISKEFIPYQNNLLTVTVAGKAEQFNLKLVTRIL